MELAMGKTATTSTTLGTKLAEAKNRLAELYLASKEGKEVTAEQFREANLHRRSFMIPPNRQKEERYEREAVIQYEVD